jgi:hypothetical protein
MHTLGLGHLALVTTVLTIPYANVRSTWGENSLVSALCTIMKIQKKTVLKVEGKVDPVLN